MLNFNSKKNLQNTKKNSELFAQHAISIFRDRYEQITFFHLKFFFRPGIFNSFSARDRKKCP